MWPRPFRFTSRTATSLSKLSRGQARYLVSATVVSSQSSSVGVSSCCLQRSIIRDDAGSCWRRLTALSRNRRSRRQNRGRDRIRARPRKVSPSLTHPRIRRPCPIVRRSAVRRRAHRRPAGRAREPMIRSPASRRVSGPMMIVRAVDLVGAFKPAGDIHGVADHRVIQPDFRSDIADQHVAGIDADPDLARLGRDRRPDPPPASRAGTPTPRGSNRRRDRDSWRGAPQNAITASPMNLSMVPPLA